MDGAGPARGKITSYQDLIVWQRSMQLIEELIPALLRLPRYEMFGSTRRCASPLYRSLATFRKVTIDVLPASSCTFWESLAVP